MTATKKPEAPKPAVATPPPVVHTEPQPLRDGAVWEQSRAERMAGR